MTPEARIELVSFGKQIDQREKSDKEDRETQGGALRQEFWVGPAANLTSSHICLFGENPLDSEATLDLQAGGMEF